MAKKGGKRKAAPGDVATNRQASYRYELLDRFECGIELQGSEVKSLREGGVQLKDAYAALEGGELWLHRMYVAPYRPAARDNHEPERPRKLLLHRREIERLDEAATAKGMTLIVTRVYLKGGRVKCEVGVARGKKLYDKRETEMRRTVERETRAQLKERNR